MTNAELIAALRYCAEHEGCDYYIAKDCPREDTWVCGSDCEQILMHDAAAALEAADEKITKLKNPKAYIAVDFKGGYVLCQANYVYSDGTRLSSEIAKVRVPLEDSGHGMNLGNNTVIPIERKNDEQADC